MEAIFVWTHFLKAAILLVVVYGLLKLIVRLPVIFPLQQGLNSKFKDFLNLISIYFIPISVVILFIIFIGINPILHGIFFLVIISLGYRHIQHYFNGIIFKMNPLIEIGANIIVDKHEGKIESFHAFGVILHTGEGERFVHYNDLERHGFSITHKEDGTLRQTVYLAENSKKDLVLDLLFENPMVDFYKKPTIKKIKGELYWELQMTLEKGVLVEDVVLFLKQHDVVVAANKNILINGNI